MRGQERGQLRGEVCAQRFCVGDAQTRHVRTNLWRAAPLIEGGFIAAHMQPRGREDGDDLFQDFLQRSDGVRQWIDQVATDAKVGRHFHRRLQATKLRVGSDQGAGMAGQLDLRHDGDAAHGGVGDDLAQVVLGVVAAVGCAVVRVCGAGGKAETGIGAVCTDFGQLGECFDLDAPALIVGQVQVQPIEVMHCQQVNEAQDRLLGSKVAHDIEHTAAPAKARGVFDGAARCAPRHARQRRRPPVRRRQQLTQRKKAVDQAGSGRGDDLHPVGVHGQCVAFAVGFIAGQPQHELGGGGVRWLKGQSGGAA